MKLMIGRESCEHLKLYTVCPHLYLARFFHF